MQQTQKELLLQILTIINYAKDKEQFIKEYEAMNYLEALLHMLERLPEHMREKLKATVGQGNGEEIKKLISKETYDEEVAKVSEEAVKNFVDVISPVLNLNQKERISALMRQG